jgi:hypothetical protein
MSNSKISALTSATTPLAGTEVLPIVQSGATVNATVANITGAGTYPGSFTTLDSSGNTTLGDTTTDTVKVNGYMGVGVAAAPSISVYASSTALTTTNQRGFQSSVFGTSAATVKIAGYWSNIGTAATAFTCTDVINFYALNAIKGAGSTITNLHGLYIENQTQGTNNYGITSLVSSGANKWNIYASGTASNYLAGGLNVGATADPGAGNISLTGNVIQGTAAKGFDFSANTPLAGKTSTILNWYEEGTWTPNQGAGLTLVGAFSSTGRYTRIGRQVSISGTVTGATSVVVTAAGVITSNLPFTVVTAGHGDATNVAINASATVICTGTNVTSAAAIAATGTITFSATYFV